VSRRTRRRIAALEAEVRILAGEVETLHLMIGRLTVDPQNIASSITDAMAAARLADDLPPGITSVTELMTGAEYAALDEELWGRWDAPTVAYTVAEEAAWAEIIRPYVSGGQS
jgi:hypothetical protein